MRRRNHATKTPLCTTISHRNLCIVDGGLGWLIFTAQDADLTAEVILGMVLIGAIWILLDRYILRPIEADTIQRWGLVQR
ncbi:MAG: hypothetical protein O7G88_13375 [bacterium]|nr:hypothetical protein [bacterium]